MTPRQYSYIAILSVFFITCRDNVIDENGSAPINSIRTRTSVQNQQEIQQTQMCLDTLLFKNFADSLISSLAGDIQKVSVKTGTISSMGQFNFLPYVDSAYTTTKVRYNVNPKVNLSFTIYESRFLDTSKVKRLFASTRAFGQDISVRSTFKHERAPAGLSKGYDFLIMYPDKILVLSVPCTYSDHNYNVLLKGFKQAIKCQPADTIVCRCGQFCM